MLKVLYISSNINANVEESVTSGGSNTLSIVSIVIAVIGTILVPILLPYFQNKKKQNQLDSEMIRKEYTQKIDDIIEGYTFSTDQIFINEIESKIDKLDKLENKELVYLTSENQFEMIRLVEFVKIYFEFAKDIAKIKQNQIKILNNDSSDKLQEVKEEVVKIKQNGLKNIKKEFHDKKNNYIKLETNNLAVNPDNLLIGIENKIEEYITENTGNLNPNKQ